MMEDRDRGYEAFLDRQLEEIDEILCRLLLEYLDHKPIDSIIAEIEEWMGDDWYVDLSEEDRKRLDVIKGWTYD